MNHSAAPSLSQVSALSRWRYAKDRVATVGVTFGGLSVIFAVLLIFFYLLWVVVPLFYPASLEPLRDLARPGSTAPTLHLAMEEQGEVGVRVAADGELVFFSLLDGTIRQRVMLPSPLQALTIVNVDNGDLAGLGTDGRLYRFAHKHRLTYPEGEDRVITSRVEFPYGQEGLDVGAGDVLSVRDTDTRLLIAVAQSGQREVRLLSFSKASSFLSTEVTLEPEGDVVLPLAGQVGEVLIDPLQDWLYAIDTSRAQMDVFSVRQPQAPTLIESVSLARSGESVTAATMLAGGISLLTAASDGVLTQWFPLRDREGRTTVEKVRQFAAPEGQMTRVLATEYARRGFISISAGGHLAVFHSTSERKVLDTRLEGASITHATYGPRADYLLLENDQPSLQLLQLHNEHPEISFKALWGKIWYESYQEPDYVWQASAANSDFEPKFSLAPLSFGTLKAAFYAMLFAVPLALAGAVFTAYFMAPALRQTVKPTIEVMEALPTVILGFLAGLWLAPFVETYLPGIFVMIVFLIIAMPLTGYAWSCAPAAIRHRVADGWQPVILMLPLILAGAAALFLSRPIELAFFDGNMPQWLANEAGIPYSQRNSLVVGLAMGFAVIPTIFSIAEDAVFGVPKSLSQGSLALGATPWQTLTRVILPTASPGIFSALMIGLGRAVGETMIVLMATGNTPIMDINIFEGFRTLSANIAVEMPESEVGSTHFRILFLAGLVLFMFTFFFNTLAEIVRQRLRMKYSNL